MAVKTYGTTNINWGSVYTWANNVNSGDVSVSGSSTGWARDIFPDPGATNISVSGELYNNKIFYGEVHAKANVSVQVTLPYTGTSVSANNSQVIKNVSYNDHGTVRLVATPTYPYVFSKWTSDSAGTNSLSTSATLNLTSIDHTSVQDFYAHVVAPSTNQASLATGATAAQACSSLTTNTIYWSSADGSVFTDAYKLYTNASLTTTVADGFWSDGTEVVQTTSGVVSNAQLCTL